MSTPEGFEPRRRRGRPLTTQGTEECTRCARMMGKPRVRWIGEALCNSCFYTAMRHAGICPDCGHEGVLPGRARRGSEVPVCLALAGNSRRVNKLRAARIGFSSG